MGLSEHARNVLLESLERDEPRVDVNLSSQAPVPEQLTTVERHTLATLHRILARLVPEEDLDEEQREEVKWALGRDGVQREQLRKAKIIENGWVGEYPHVFNEVITELPRRDSGLVLDILDMFRFVGASLDRLSNDDRERMSETAIRALQFSGFDANDSYEGALLAYAQDLISRGKWSMLRNHFSADADGGNSHYPTVDTYRRMLAVFTPIWQERLRASSYGPDAFNLTRDELNQVAAGRVHPDHRK